ncbi:hypothetical protein BDY17DRAFT_100726 [Neohortaea acidophila]|uniref:Uncharacterized protein n=1 Tax=Neohortaea acidophila TaxID=245834 RepID=A0A6A6PYU7_9PEZI|nr:uncharacterized protein BDY17DRAFT_100726 [Neohortaea acidophila]KAF2485310.1 hypothetical protein BDY17DRAFT_100726 [Neohortaea acidophila]
MNRRPLAPFPFFHPISHQTFHQIYQSINQSVNPLNHTLIHHHHHHHHHHHAWASHPQLAPPRFALARALPSAAPQGVQVQGLLPPTRGRERPAPVAEPPRRALPASGSASAGWHHPRGSLGPRGGNGQPHGLRGRRRRRRERPKRAPLLPQLVPLRVPAVQMPRLHALARAQSGGLRVSLRALQSGHAGQRLGRRRLRHPHRGAGVRGVEGGRVGLVAVQRCGRDDSGAWGVCWAQGGGRRARDMGGESTLPPVRQRGDGQSGGGVDPRPHGAVVLSEGGRPHGMLPVVSNGG